MNTIESNRYTFTKCFCEKFEERICKLTEDVRAFILANCTTGVKHVKYDDKGRHSEYITFRVHNQLVTVVADADTHRLITVVKETHSRRRFK